MEKLTDEQHAEVIRAAEMQLNELIRSASLAGLRIDVSVLDHNEFARHVRPLVRCEVYRRLHGLRETASPAAERTSRI